MKLSIVNRTAYPKAEVRRLIREGFGDLDVSGTPIEVLPSDKHAHGWAQWGWDCRITIWLPGPERFPKRGWRRHRSSPMNHDWQNWREALLAIAAHEGRHIDLFRTGSIKKMKSKQAIEMSCEAYEHWTLKRYRAKMSA